MTVRVNLPPGCEGLNMQDGTKYTARPGQHIDVAERHASAIENLSTGGDAGLVSAKGGHTFGTKKERECPQCGWLWNVWTTVCHRCHIPTLVKE
jgi:hypothetical protein